jgi:O-antigen ligase
MVVFGIIVIKVYNSSFLERTLNAFLGTDDSANIRYDLWRISFQKFVNNPLYGNDFFLEYTWNSKAYMIYSHNFLIEAFYTTGIIGGVLFLLICIYAIKITLNLISSSKYGWISLFSIQYFLLSLLSSSIYSNYIFWTLIALLFSYTFLENNENKEFKEKHHVNNRN